jgi:nicotinamidase-related amidase
MFDRDMVEGGCRRLIGAADIMDLPVMVTVQNPEKMGDTVPEIAEVLPARNTISKMTFSCCGDEGFNARLAALERRTVILCGVETHICVSQTALDLIAQGYKVHVPEDAVCSRLQATWRAGLERMRDAGVIITTTESVIYELLGCAGTDEFREVLKLVR